MPPMPLGPFEPFGLFGSFGHYRPMGFGPDPLMILGLCILALPLLKISHEATAYFEKLNTQCMCHLDWQPGQEMYVQVYDYGGNSTHFRAPRCSWYC